MNEDYRVPKRRVSVVVELPQEQVAVGIFLSEQAATHSGPERPSDLFNGPDDFLVVAFDGGSIECVRRDRVITVAVAYEHELVSPDASESPELDEQLPIILVLEDGRAIEGVARYQMPGERRRLVDFLNHDERFLRLDRQGGVLLVNKQRIVLAKEA